MDNPGALAIIPLKSAVNLINMQFLCFFRPVGTARPLVKALAETEPARFRPGWRNSQSAGQPPDGLVTRDRYYAFSPGLGQFHIG